MPHILYLARHATPDRSRTDLIYHQLPGPPLTEQGIQEAHALGAFFLAGGVRQILASPFERCRQTAEIAAKTAGIAWLLEDNLGELQPGETSEEVLQRVLPVFQRMEAESLRAGPLAVITHGGVVSVLLKHLGLDSAALSGHKTFDYGNLLPPAGVWLAERAPAETAPAGTAWKLHLAFQPEPIPLST